MLGDFVGVSERFCCGIFCILVGERVGYLGLEFF